MCLVLGYGERNNGLETLSSNEWAKCSITYIEGIVQTVVPVHRRLHGEVVKLVREDDRANIIKGSVLCSVNESLVVGVDCVSSDTVDPVLPVERIIFPEDCIEVQTLRDGADAVVDIAVGRTPTGRSNTSCELDGLEGVIEFGEGLLVGERSHYSNIRKGIDAPKPGDSLL